MGVYSLSTLGERIRTIRNKYNLNQTKLGEKLGVNPSYISRVERDKENPSDTFIYLFCKLFFIRQEWLLKGEYPIIKKPDDIAGDLRYKLDSKTLTDIIQHLSGQSQQTGTIVTGVKQDEYLSLMFNYLETIWNLSQDTQGWLKVQFNEAFPKFEEWREKQLNKKVEHEETEK
jgi:transcriptional regulator with XRE-family HTH domain